MPNPYHDPNTGRFTTKSGSGRVANFGGTSGGMNRARLTAVRQERQAAAGGARNAQRQRALKGVDRRLGAAADKSNIYSEKYLKGRMARTREAVAKINESRAKDYGVPVGPRNPAARPNMGKRPGAGTGGSDKYLASTDDLASLRGRLTKPAKAKETLDESVRAITKGRGGTLGAVADGIAEMGLGKSERAKQVRAAEKLESAAEYRARLANDRVELAKRNNRAAGRKPLPKGYNANATTFPVVKAEDLPSTGRGVTYTQDIQARMDRQAAENAKLPKPASDSPWMKKARAQAEAAIKPVTSQSSKKERLANVGRIYGKGSPLYKSARKTLFGTN